ncbi:MAG TPA: hypothetical protein VFI02_05480 [Armatimonadota bacterium]|nr:hypothetical protein [Armatimonadota bacterium]
MLTRTLLAVILVLCTSFAFAVPFGDLNFESAAVPDPGPYFDSLEWASVAPRWSHSSGDDTGWVYYYHHHVGCSQWFMLVDQYTAGYSPLAGNYSLALQSGGLYSGDTHPWVNAFISISGYFPYSASQIRLKATGNFGVYVNNTRISMFGGGSSWYADVSAYRGKNATVRIQNEDVYDEEWYLHTPVLVDDIQVPLVPEPSGCLILAMSLIGSGLLIRRKRA